MLPNTQANRVTDKLTHIHDRIYCCRSGSAADTQAVADVVHHHSQLYTAVYGGPPPVATVAALFEKMCYENKDQLTAGIIVAGWDEEKGGSVYNIPLGGGMFQQPWAIGGGLLRGVARRCATYGERQADNRLGLDVRVRLLRRDIPGWLGRRGDCQLCQEQ